MPTVDGTDEKVDCKDLMGDERSPMTKYKAMRFRLELLYWKKHPKEGVHGVGLIEGALAVCDAYIQRCGRDERNAR